MRRTIKGFVGFAVVCTFAGGVARAEEKRTHDGFYLHLDLGGGGFSSKAEEGGNSAEFSGGAGQFSVAVGYNVVPNLALAGHLWGVSADDPDFELNGVKVGTDDVRVRVGGVGVNLTYYFMPVNIYLSATPTITVASLKVGAAEFETDSGFGIRLAAGKEWWVSDSWGIGLNLQYAYSSNDEKGLDPATWKTNWFGVAFSATYD
jgi:hypothetical protein